MVEDCLSKSKCFIFQVESNWKIACQILTLLQKMLAYLVLVYTTQNYDD